MSLIEGFQQALFFIAIASTVFATIVYVHNLKGGIEPNVPLENDGGSEENNPQDK